MYTHRHPASCRCFSPQLFPNHCDLPPSPQYACLWGEELFSLGLLLSWEQTIFASYCCCCSKLAQTWSLKTTHVYYLAALEAEVHKMDLSGQNQHGGGLPAIWGLWDELVSLPFPPSGSCLHSLGFEPPPSAEPACSILRSL